MRETGNWDWQVGKSGVADLARIRREFSAVEEVAVTVAVEPPEASSPRDPYSAPGD